MPTSHRSSGRRRFSLRGPLSAFAALSGILLLATCDLDKVTATKKENTGTTLNFTISGGSDVILAGTTPLSVTPIFPGTITRWSSSAPAMAKVDSLTGVVTGVAIGQAMITARLLGMELDTGLVKSQQVTVRYKGVRITPIDSITGLGQTRALAVFGTNAQDVVQPVALTSSCTFTVHDSGSTNATIASLSGTAVKALKNGAAYVKAVCSTLSDSTKVKVRQVAKSITFSDTVYTATAMNFNRTIPITVKDVADSAYASLSRARWGSNDTSIVAIDSVTGVLRVKKRDSTYVFVRVDTVTRTTKVRLRQVVGSLTKTAGDLQTDTIGRKLADTLKATALDSGGVAVPGATVTFALGAHRLNAAITDSVKITDANGVAALGSWTLGTEAGPQTVIASVGTVNTTFTATARAAGPKKLAFSVQPTSAVIGAIIAPSIKVAIQDSVGNLVDTATSSVTISFNFSPNGSAVLGGTLTKAAVNGIATFDNITVSAGGAGFVLLAEATGLTSAVSNSFDAFGTATKLGFVTQPVGSTAGGVMQSVRVAVQDANGATVTTATDNVTIALGANPSAGTLSGTTTVAAVNGVATFDGLSISASGSGYTMVATATGRTSATSNAFTVQAVGTASKLAFSVQPSNAVSGVAIAPAIKVQVLDVNGALVTNSSQQITLTVQDGTAISGTTAVSAVGGVATFNNVSIGKAGTGFRLVATATGSTITTATSATFNITAGAASRLGFLQNPTHTVTSQAVSPAVTVAVQDANGNTVSTAPQTSVTLAIGGGGNCAATNITGLGPVNTASGIATFSAITPTAAFTSCTLTASATGLTSGTSTAFNSVAAGGAVKLAFTTEPAASTTAGVTMNAGTVNVQDGSGNNVTAPSQLTITLSVLAGPGSFQGGSTTSLNTSSFATFSNVAFRTAGTYRLLASAPGYDPDTSAAFTVVPAAANNLSFVTQPVTIVAGVPFPNTVQVGVVDQYGNVVTGATNVIQLSANMINVGGSLRFNNGLFNVSATAVNGIASFPGLSIRGASYGNGARMNASATNLFGSSSAFEVATAPLSALGFKTNPNLNFQAGQTLNSIQVQGQDSVGNAISDFSNAVTLTLIGGNPNAVLNGTKTAAPAGGVSTFADLSINEAGTGYQLTASATGVTTATSTAFNVNAGAAVKLVWVAQPKNTFANAPLDPDETKRPQVQVQDSFGNTVTNDNPMIRLTIVSPPAGMTLQEFGNAVSQHDFFPVSGGANVNPEVTINQAGTGIQLLATTPFRTLTSATSAAFDIAAYDTKTKLVFWNQPTNTTYRVVSDPVPLVFVADKYGNRDTLATDLITISFGSNPGGATLDTTVFDTFNGYSWLWPLTVNKAGSGYTLVASAPGLTSATSNSFNVTAPGLPAQYVNVCDMTRSPGGLYVYWIECGSAGRIIRSPAVGGWRDTLVVGIANGQRLAVDANNVYWIESGASNGNGAVRKVNVDTWVETTMASGLFDVPYAENAFAIDGTNVYFIARDNGGTTRAIKSVPVSVGGAVTPTDIFAVAPASTGWMPYFTVDGGNIYFLDPPNDVIKRVPTSGGTPVTISTTGQGGGTIFLQMAGTTLLYSQQTNLKTIANANTISSAVAPTTQIASGATFYAWYLDGNSLYANDNGNLRRYLVSDFGNVVNYGSGLNTWLQSIFTDAHDVFVYYNNNGSHIAKVPK